jgi:AcrR family transcriptional regulator/DNA-binding MarR family transcriptional regulator
MAARAPVRTRERPAHSVARMHPRVHEDRDRAEIGRRAQVAEMQRSRLLAAAVRTIDELGYTHATVATVTRAARVSRRTFYDLFANREDCLVAVLEDAALRIGWEIERAGLESLPWRERVRGGLWSILSFLDREPALARVCVVQALRGSQGVLERREEILGELAAGLDEGRSAGGARGAECPPLTAEGLVGAAFAIVYARLLRGEREPLTGLLGELMGMIVLPYLGPAAARREQSLPAPILVGSSSSRSGGEPVDMSDSDVFVAERDPLEGIPMRLTYRTARVLEAIAREPGVSNRGAGERAGITDQGQISKLLARLERLGLAQNTGQGHSRGEANAWTLTPTGVRVAQSIRACAPAEEAL